MGLPLPPLSVLLRDALKDYRAALPVSPVTFSSIEQPPLPQFTGMRNPEIVKKSNEDVLTLFPRRKAGQAPQEGGKGPVVLSVELLEKFYGMPLHTAAKKLGICQTAIKKVCRRLGIKKWPYKDTRVPVKRDESCSPSAPPSLDRRPNVPQTQPLDYRPNVPNAQPSERRPLSHEVVFCPSSICFLCTDPGSPIKDPREDACAIRTLLSLKDAPDIASSRRELAFRHTHYPPGDARLHAEGC
uniref:RWP-RK domain-containing protein n=1 Tax=Cryptomonas curvata TaxID=233186 RepID=A0A7S0LX11_9CRYP|mmetsp:Transcript_14358/g.30693  ORF Transcript_14358/g.30693 Transcript_14358/m.30693 type:complete len:242 (+) Transcript_14358:36-761(+)